MFIEQAKHQKSESASIQLYSPTELEKFCGLDVESWEENMIKKIEWKYEYFPLYLVFFSVQRQN
jgi:hypothetical protein